MQLRNVVVFVDGGQAVLAASCEILRDKKWKPQLITMQDIVSSEFVFDVFNQLVGLQLHGVALNNSCLVYAVANAEPRSKDVCVAKIMGPKIAQASLNVEAAQKLEAMIINMNAAAAKVLGGADKLKAILQDVYKAVPHAATAILDATHRLELFRVPSFREHAVESAKDDELAKYLRALEIDTIFNTTYIGKAAQQNPIKEDQLVMPYNWAVKAKVSNGVVTPWAMGHDTIPNEIGPVVPLPIPDYKCFLTWQEASNSGLDVDSDDEQDDGNTSEFLEDTAVFSSEDEQPQVSVGAADATGGVSVTLMGDPVEIEDMINAVEFEVIQVDPDKTVEANRGGVYKAVPLSSTTYPVTRITEYYDCFEYQKVVSSPECTATPIDPRYVGGFEEANRLGWFPREIYWLEAFKAITRDLLMAERAILSVVEADEQLKSGISSSILTNFIVEFMIRPILQIQRGYTGRVPFDCTKYRPELANEAGEEGASDSSYVSMRTCFYTVIDKKYMIVPTPAEYMPAMAQRAKAGRDPVRYTTLFNSLNLFVKNYVKSPYKWLEVMLKLLRSDVYKPTMLVLDEAKEEKRREDTPIYLDLNTCETTNYLDTLSDLKPEDEQSIAFGISLVSPQLQTLHDNLAAMLKSDVLGDKPKYADGYIIGLGLWSAYKNNTRVDKCDFMDIFTFVEYMQKGREIGGIPINVLGVRYDKESKRFVREQNDDGDLEHTLEAVSDGKEVSGIISLKDALSEDVFLDFEYTMGGHVHKEYRKVLESEAYILARSRAAQATGVAKTGQDPMYGVFHQLAQLSGNPSRLDTSLANYNRYKDASKIPSTLQIPQYMTSMLDIQYSVNFLKLITFCQHRGIAPQGDFMAYLNAVADFMGQRRSLGGTTGSLEDFRAICDRASSWKRCTFSLPKNEKPTVCLLGEASVGDRHVFIVINNFKSGREEFKRVMQRFTKATLPNTVSLELAYSRIIKPRLATPEELLTPTPNCIAELQEMRRKLMEDK